MGCVCVWGVVCWWQEALRAAPGAASVQGDAAAGAAAGAAAAARAPVGAEHQVRRLGHLARQEVGARLVAVARLGQLLYVVHLGRARGAGRGARGVCDASVCGGGGHCLHWLPPGRGCALGSGTWLTHARDSPAASSAHHSPARPAQAPQPAPAPTSRMTLRPALCTPEKYLQPPGPPFISSSQPSSMRPLLTTFLLMQ